MADPITCRVVGRPFQTEWSDKSYTVVAEQGGPAWAVGIVYKQRMGSAATWIVRDNDGELIVSAADRNAATREQALFRVEDILSERQANAQQQKPPRSDQRDEAVRGILGRAVAEYRGSHASERRHPAQVTADRLADALDKWYEHFDGADRDAVARVRHVLIEIAEGRRG